MGSVKRQITLRTAATVTAVFVLLIGVITWRVRTDQTRQAEAYGNQIVSAIATKTNGNNAKALQITQAIVTMQESGSFGSREKTSGFLKQITESNPWIVGAYVAYEPNADGQDKSWGGRPESDGTGRFLPYWNRLEGSVALEPLVDTETSDYYVLPFKEGRSLITEPLLYDGVLMASFVAPIKLNGKVVGVGGVDRTLGDIQDELKSLKPYESAQFVLLSAGGQFIAVPDDKLLGTSVESQSQYRAALGDLAGAREPGVKTVKNPFTGAKNWLFYAPIATGGWTIGLLVKQAEVLAGVQQTTWLMILISTFGLLLTVVLLTITVGRAIKPIGSIVAALEALATGSLAKSVKITSNDEFGRLAGAFNQTVESLRHLVSNVKETSEQVGASSEELASSANQVGEVTQQVTFTIQQVAKGSDEQAKAAQRASEVVEGMSASIDQVTGSAQKMATDASLAVETAGEGRKAVGQAVSQMGTIRDSSLAVGEAVKRLGTRSQEIGQIVEVITGIADQTNLLALNAAIEAARAGEQGRGFAVVAEEVRKLAEQSRTAAEQISSLICDIQTDTDRAVTIMDAESREVAVGEQVIAGTGDAFSAITKAVENVVGQIQEISAATRQLSSDSQQVVKAVENIAAITEQSAAGAEEVSASSEEQAASVEEIAASAQSLAQMAQELQKAVAQFSL